MDSTIAYYSIPNSKFLYNHKKSIYKYCYKK